jgi:hypothetical protein
MLFPRRFAAAAFSLLVPVKCFWHYHRRIDHERTLFWWFACLWEDIETLACCTIKLCRHYSTRRQHGVTTAETRSPLNATTRQLRSILVVIVIDRMVLQYIRYCTVRSTESSHPEECERYHPTYYGTNVGIGQFPELEIGGRSSILYQDDDNDDDFVWRKKKMIPTTFDPSAAASTQKKQHVAVLRTSTRNKQKQRGGSYCGGVFAVVWLACWCGRLTVGVDSATTTTMFAVSESTACFTVPASDCCSSYTSPIRPSSSCHH